MKTKLLKLLLEYGMICDPDEPEPKPVCERCIQFEKELSELLNHAAQTEMPSEEEVRNAACIIDEIEGYSNVDFIKGADYVLDYLSQSLTKD